jgi:hypothetical protein
MSDAGLDVASAIIDGMVKGLGKGASRVASAARDAAAKALDAAKSFLGIKSPSKRFETEVGAESTEGMALGFDKNVGVVEKAATRVGSAALESMKQSLADVSKIVESNVELAPVITPVLDLTSVNRSAAQMKNIFGSETIQIGATFSKATDAAIGYQQNQQARDDNTMTSHSEQSVTFIQNNTSPKPLNEAEIYRNTSSQISIAKGALSDAVQS